MKRRRVASGKPGRTARICAFFLLLVAGLNPVAQARGDFETWKDPQAHFDLPPGWHVSETTWVAERLIFATPEPVDPQALLAGEVTDLDALIQVKIDALDPHLKQIPLTQLIEDLKARYRSAAGAARFRVLDEETGLIGGREGALLLSEQDDFIDHSALFRAGEYLYEVRVAYDEDERSRYETLAEAVFESFQIPNLESEWETKRWDTFLGSARLPESWHSFEVEGASPSVTLTEEPLAGSGEFDTGVTLVKLHDYAAAFGLEGDDPGAAYRHWLTRLLGGLAETPYRLLDAREEEVSGFPSLVVELSYLDPDRNEHIQLINVSTALDGHFYNATFEAPVARFYALRPMYLAAYRSLRWK